MTTKSIIDTIWGYSTDQLLKLEATVSKVRHLKEELNLCLEGNPHPSTVLEEEVGPGLAPSSSTSVRPLLPPTAARDPLRPPKPGSLRATIHAILREAEKPLRRVEIIHAVARRQGSDISAKLKSKVGEVLTCSLDPRIKKVAYGIYRYQP